MAQLPRLPSGKLNKVSLRETYAGKRSCAGRRGFLRNRYGQMAQDHRVREVRREGTRSRASRSTVLRSATRFHIRCSVSCTVHCWKRTIAPTSTSSSSKEPARTSAPATTWSRAIPIARPTKAAAAPQEVSYRSVSATVDDDSWQLEATQRLTLAMFDLHKPVIAKVHGNCMAGGTDLALMCDVVDCGRGREDRFSRDARQRHAAESHVDLSRRAAVGETTAADRRLCIGDGMPRESASCSTRCRPNGWMKKSTNWRDE